MKSEPVPQISVAEAVERWRSGDGQVLLLDVREPEEVAVARIEGATHIPMGDIPTRLPSLDPAKETIVFCHHGQRSLSVAAFLLKQDFEDVKSMRGGIDAWSLEIDPTVPRYS